ncbi:MAG: hypothetical protein WCI05_00910 [Myxococcales bacterium]
MSGWYLATALLTWGAAHGVLVVSVGRLRWFDGALMLLVPPLAVYCGLRHGMTVRVGVWCGALVAYGVGVAIA